MQPLTSFSVVLLKCILTLLKPLVSIEGTALTNHWTFIYTPNPSVCCFLTQVVVFVVWSMKKGLPLGALRTSQPAGKKLGSPVASVLEVCCGVSCREGTVGWGGAGVWDEPSPNCAATGASDVFYSWKTNATQCF